MITECTRARMVDARRISRINVTECRITVRFNQLHQSKSEKHSKIIAFIIKNEYYIKC